MASVMGAQPMDPGLALAIHTSSPDLAMALAPFPWSGDAPVSLRCKATGRGLANVLHRELLRLLPASQWRRLAALAVATGPGGFTGTRLGVVLARTMARDLQIPLFGCGSFVLMARRLAQRLLREHPEGCAVQLEQALRKRGWIRARYRITAHGGVEECQAPPTPDNRGVPWRGITMASSPCRSGARRRCGGVVAGTDGVSRLG